MRQDGVTCTSLYLALVHTRMSDPTPIFRNMPGLSPDQAAGLVCRAIVERPREIEPWWLSLTVPALQAARGPWELANSLVYRMTTDSRASARAARVPPVPEPRDDEEAHERSGEISPVPGGLGSSGAGEPAP